MYKVSITLLAVLVLNAAKPQEGVAATLVGNNVANFSVLKFMNTSTPIWTVLTSRQPPRMCMVDMVNNTTENIIYFNRSWMDDGGIWVHHKCEGYVDNTPAMKDTMSVKCRVIAPMAKFEVTYELLEFADGNNTCGVFHVYTARDHKGEDWYDLRSKYNNWTGPLTTCLEQFNIKRNASGQSHTVYNNSTCLHNKFWHR
uniref:Putative group i salivary lipocalin n=1 Tax=Rhipicephalus pulchellus TaxID=72859 RepID=L7LSM7_RHIPC